MNAVQNDASRTAIEGPPEATQAGRNAVTSNDAHAIRRHVASVAFVHLPRIAQEWGISEGRVKIIAGRLIEARR